MIDEHVTSMTFKNKVTGLAKLERYEERLKSLKKALSEVPNTVSVGNFKSNGIGEMLETMSKNVEDINNKITKIDKSLSKVGNTASAVKKVLNFTAIIKKFQRLTATMTSLVKKSAEYVENLNLMKVAFHDTGKEENSASKEGQRLVNTLAEMYGLDESSLTRTVGIFKQLGNAMGLDDKVGSDLAKTLTKLSIDTASLYNLSFERTSSVLQSALAGQTKPVRTAFGADITEQTLQVTMDSYGIDETVKQLSYAEKRLIIVTSLINQLTESQNDFGRTINCGTNLKKLVENFVNLCKKGVSILLNIFANDKDLCEI